MATPLLSALSSPCSPFHSSLSFFFFCCCLCVGGGRRSQERQNRQKGAADCSSVATGNPAPLVNLADVSPLWGRGLHPRMAGFSLGQEERHTDPPTNHVASLHFLM